MSYTLLKATKRQAQKAHRCIWCGHAIESGSTYIDERSVYNGELQRHKWHPECLDACQDEASEYGYGFEFSPFDNERPPLEQQ